jgi:3-dehydroquinate synthase
MGYGEWLHGEAVATGMVLAAELSAQLGWLDSAVVERIRSLLRKARLPVVAPKALSSDRFLELMAVDKKVQDGKLRLVLMKGLGESLITSAPGVSEIRAALDAHLKGA